MCRDQKPHFEHPALRAASNSRVSIVWPFLRLGVEAAASAASRLQRGLATMRTNLFRGFVLGTLIFTLMIPAGEMRRWAQTKTSGQAEASSPANKLRAFSIP